MMDSFPRGRRPRDDSAAAAGASAKDSTSSSTVKRKRASEAAKEAAASTPDKEYLFGDANKKSGASSKKKKKKTEDGVTTDSFALPLGGGHVVHSKNKGKENGGSTIEALSFQKMAKGTKLLGIVREVHDDFCIVALPNLLAGYVLPPTKSDQAPLSQQLVVGQVLAVYVVKVASEPFGKGKQQVMRRRIQVSVEPHHLNALGDGESTWSQHDLIRGRISSVEDHGVLVDLGNGRQGFCKFTNVRDAGSNDSLLLNEGRVHDFCLEDKTSGDTVASSRIASLCLLNAHALSKRHLPSTYHPTLQDLKPGSGLVNCKIEAVARNGLLVSFGIFRGAIHVNHLGGHWVPTNKQGADGEWKAIFSDTVRNVPARIIAVDARTKVIRLSLQPHLLHLSLPPALPPVGTIIDNAIVIRLDPGIGALLSLPPLEGEAAPKKLANSALTKNESYREASLRPAAYVHISKATSSRMSEADFGKEYAPSTQHKLRILSTTNWVEGIAGAATATDTVEAHVLTHSDLVPGAIYRNVPVLAQLNGGSILVDFGMGIKGLIPALQLFDKSNNTSSDYRIKLRKEKFAVDKKVDVRVLEVDTIRKSCLVTAKKSLLKADKDCDVVDDYSKVVVGQRATGYISKIDHTSVYVTFYNKVYGRVTARSLAAELGVEDHKVDYGLGDVVKCRVISCRRRVGKNLNSYVDDEMEIVDDDQRGYWDLNLSLHVEDGVGDDEEAAIEKARSKSRRIHLQSGAILLPKSMKIVQLMPSIDKKRGNGFIPGHAIVRIKSKFIMKEEDVDALPYVECKVPFDQILDTYDNEDTVSKESMDAFAKKHLTVGKKIDMRGLILSDPKKSSDEYASGIGKLPIVSLRPKLIDTVEKIANSETEKSQVLIPTAETNLYIGAYVQGFVHQADPKHGAFVRFLDGVTGLVPKLKKGNSLKKWDTVTCKIIALDVTCQPPKILLQRASPGSKEEAAKKLIVKPGDKINSVKVLEVNFSRANVQILDDKLSSNKMVRARIHVTMGESSAIAMPKRRKGADTKEDKETIRKGHPFYKWKKGKTLKDLVCVSASKKFGVTFVELTTRPAAEQGEGTKDLVFVDKPEELKAGMKVSCIIVAAAKSRRGIWVQPSPGLNCFVPALELSEDADVLNELESYFPMGARLDCRVMDKDAWKKKKNWGIRVPKLKTDEETKGGVKDSYVPFLSVLLANRESTNAYKIKKPIKGELMVGRLNRSMRLYRAPSVMLELRGGFHGRCCITELEEPDEWANMPLGRQHGQDDIGAKKRRAAAEGEAPKDADGDSDDDDAVDADGQGSNFSSFEDGDFMQCRVLEPIPSEPVVEVSLRPSRLEGDLDDDELPEENELVNAYVVDTNKKGCFLRIARRVDGRVILKNIADGFLHEPETAFPMGRLVVGRVTTIKAGNKKGKTKILKTVDVNMRESVIMEEAEKLKYEDVKVDEKYKGIVTRIEDYGVFVRLDNSELTGLVHMSECSDAFIKTIQGLYDPGDLVKILVIKKDEENKKFGFSMKASHFEDDEDSEDEDEDEDMEDVDESGEEEAQGADSDDENYVSKLAAKMQTGDDDDDDDEASSDEDSDDDNDDESKDEDAAKSAMDTDVGFNWGAAPADKKAEDDDEDSDEDSGSDDESDDEVAGKSGHSSRKKAAARRKEEVEISKREKALADGTADENPETSADFERLLASEPNNSEKWIRYMAYYLSLADMEGCRRVANRAFDRIDFRQEGEKLNVWTALLTMELKFGGNFDATVDRACEQNNPKQVYLRVCELLEKEVDSESSGGEAVTRANNMYQKMCKKFRGKKTVWIAHLGYLLKNGRHQAAHALLKRALLSLPEYKHIETMSKLAQLEFEHGSVERGRTVFDGILSKYPKRLDLLFVFVDKEVKAGEIRAARSLLKKTAESSKRLTDKQMKKLFRKWMKMEEGHGTAESQEDVKDVARAYVERTSK